MLVAVTGSTGFVGRHIVRRLHERGHGIRALVRDPRSVPPELASATLISGDLRDAAALGALSEGADAVVHLVGIIVEKGADTFEAVHVEGARRMAEAARAAGCRRFVHMSAQGARQGPGATAYQTTKAKGEEAVRNAGGLAAIFRPSIIVGAGNAPVRTLANLHRWLPAVPVFGRGDFPLQPIWVEDVALAFALAVEQPDVIGTLELGGPDVIAYEDFVRAIGRATGHARPVVHVPLPLVRLSVRVFGLLGPAAPITHDQLEMLVQGNATPDNAIDRVFGIRPAPLDHALRFLKGGRDGGRDAEGIKNQTRG